MGPHVAKKDLEAFRALISHLFYGFIKPMAVSLILTIGSIGTGNPGLKQNLGTRRWQYHQMLEAFFFHLSY